MKTKTKKILLSILTVALTLSIGFLIVFFDFSAYFIGAITGILSIEIIKTIWKK